MKKLFTLFLGFALCSTMNAQTVRMLTMGLGTPGLDEPQFMGLSISPDGRYACGSLDMASGYFVADLVNNDFMFELTEDPEGAELRHVDNNGLAIGYNGPGVTYSFEGVETVLATPSDEYKYVLGEALTNDGSILVGSLVAKGYLTYAAYSKDGGEWTLLPEADEALLGEYVGTGSAAKYISGDGKVILGSIGNFGPAVLWTLGDNGEYVVDPLFSKYVIMTDEDMAAGEKTLYGLHPAGLSNNGKYALFQGTIVEGDIPMSVPVVYDVESKELTIYSEPQEIDQNGTGLLPTAIADNGTMVGIVGTQPLFESFGSFIWEAGKDQAQLLGQAFAAYDEMFGVADSIGYCLPTGMSADGRYILGYGFFIEDFEDPESLAYFTTFLIDVKGTSGVESIETAGNVSVAQIYSVDGSQRARLAKGINIVRMSDGSVRKIVK